MAHPSAILGFAVYWFGHLLTLYAALRAFTHSSIVLAALVLAFAAGYVAHGACRFRAEARDGIEAALAFSLRAVGVPLGACACSQPSSTASSRSALPLLPALALLPSVKQLNSDLPRFARSAA